MPHVAAVLDSADALLDNVAAFVAEGLAAGEQVLIVATAAHRRELYARLEGVPRQGEAHVIALDADEVVRDIVVDGRVSPERFEALIATALGSADRCRVYGEVASLLVSRGDVDAAMAIEAMGQELVSRTKIPVLCGYHAAAHELEPELVTQIVATHDSLITA